MSHLLLTLVLVIRLNKVKEIKMYIKSFFNYVKASSYKLPVSSLFVFLALLAFAACAPTTDQQGNNNQITASSINGCVKATAANSITNESDFAYCIQGTEQNLTSSERRKVTNYLNSASNSELQTLSANILARKSPVEASNRQAVISAILQEVIQISDAFDDFDDDDFDDDDFDDDDF